MSHQRALVLRPDDSSGVPLGHSDALALLEVMQACVSCDTVSRFRDVFHRVQGFLPFEHAVAVLGQYDHQRGVTVEQIVNISCLEQFIQECVRQDYLCRSTLARDHFARYRLKFWADARRRLRQPQRLVSLALDLGMRNGYTTGVPPRCAVPHGSMFCLSVPLARRDARTERLLEVLAPHLHLALTRVFDGQERGMGRVVLSAREREVLRLVMQGKSSWDMSVIMSLSESTVNYHLYRAMQKLDAINRPQAVAEAVRLGLLDVN